jgi:hypothetical protein
MLGYGEHSVMIAARVKHAIQFMQLILAAQVVQGLDMYACYGVHSNTADNAALSLLPHLPCSG